MCGTSVYEGVCMLSVSDGTTPSHHPRLLYWSCVRVSDVDHERLLGEVLVWGKADIVFLHDVDPGESTMISDHFEIHFGTWSVSLWKVAVSVQ